MQDGFDKGVLPSYFVTKKGVGVWRGVGWGGGHTTYARTHAHTNVHFFNFHTRDYLARVYKSRCFGEFRGI